MRAELERGYILHTRPYGDTSVIANCFTERHGRFPLIAKGVRNKKIKQRRYLQSFTPLLLSWQGKSTLKTLTNVETIGPLRSLADKRLYSGFYLNELLMRLMPEHDEHGELFVSYETALERLYANEEIEVSLRLFEMSLLSQLGYGINFYSSVDGARVEPGCGYSFLPDQGFKRVTTPSARGLYFSGEEIQAIGVGDYSLPSVKAAAKRLSRIALHPLLGGRPLESRSLFKAIKPLESKND